ATIQSDGETAATVTIPDGTPVAVVVPGARPWSPEDPALFEVELTTAVGAVVKQVTGVRRIEVDDDGVLRGNGDAIRFRGVNRHEFHPQRGRSVTVEDTRRDFQVMLEHHINAVRTSHYPPARHALDLADQMGLWVVLEGDLETHGFVERGWAGNPSDDAAWRAAILERTARMWHRDKNHPSVAMLSVGNESGNGTNLRAAADWLRSRSTLPVHYEGDAESAYTDVHSRMYATAVEWEKLASGTGHPSWPPEVARRVLNQPIVLCEFAHAMGNGPGGLNDYERVFRNHPRACGGFVWEFKDHGLTVPAPGGGTRVAYGGDFGEQVHDSNFVLDGLCFADTSPSPGMTEYAAVIDPLWIEWGRGEHGHQPHELRVGNGHDHSDLAEVVVIERRVRHGETEENRHTVPDVAPGQWHTIVLGSGSFVDVLEVEVSAVVVCGPRRTQRVRRETWAAPLPGGVPVVEAPLPVGQWPGAARGVRLSVWRAPTDNDSGGIEPVRERFGDDPRVDWNSWAGTDPRDKAPGEDPGAAISLASRWEDAGLDRLLPHRDGGLEDQVATTWRPGGGDPDPWTGHLAVAWGEGGEDWGVLEAVIDLADGPRPGRIGIELDLPVDAGAEVTWEGGGPGEAAPDSTRSIRHGRWSSRATDLNTVYPVPQASGERPDVRRLQVPLANGESAEVEVLAVELDGRPARDGLWWALTPWTDLELARARHADELADPLTVDKKWTLHLDAAYDGLGSRSCGMDVAPDARVSAKRARIVLRARGLP
ncbi:glycoside hydrolase family 2 TIM barrel-domain containing protein, partial [Kocuria sp. ZOR0020]|uniref:glycoside hydrolase family 2 TIM barrel-domain containing protein n=1 Tax=Kocuria sp. ZOR0020 TaxID=1339234 RepID=UPI000691F1AB